MKSEQRFRDLLIINLNYFIKYLLDKHYFTSVKAYRLK